MHEMWRQALTFVLAGALACFGSPVCATVCGDADGSGSVTVTDGVHVLRAAANLPSTCSVGVCDVDGSGTITVTDGVNVLRAAAGLSNACRDTVRACGGIAGGVCLAGEQCVDVPNDDCDPRQGGGDCPGICARVSPGPCAGDGDCPAPGVPCTLCFDGSAACPLTFCDRTTHQCRLVFQECPAKACGGNAGVPCPLGQRCLDDPDDSCDPNLGGVDCDGLCVKERSSGLSPLSPGPRV